MGNERFIKIDVPMGRRILVTSDIHGDVDALRGALALAGYGGDDMLVIAGDIVEKGPRSLETLRLVMELAKSENTYVLQGNVDSWRLWTLFSLSEESAAGFYDYILWWRRWNGTSFFDDMTREMGIICKSPDDVLRCKDAVIDKFHDELMFLQSLPVVLETQRFIFVHGGLREAKLSENAKHNLFDLQKYDRFMAETELKFDRYVVVGHWPVSLYSNERLQYNPIINEEKKIISIDGGCGLNRCGQLNMMIIPDISAKAEDFDYVSSSGMKKCRALEDQAEHEASMVIQWPYKDVEILEDGGEFTHVRHVASGKELWLPTDFIHSDGKCSDYTDHVLPVSAGDELEIIKSTCRGHVVKRYGVYGWYYGEIKLI